MKTLLLAAFASLLSTTAFSDTFVVDIQLAPGSDFQEVFEALASPLVTDGDTLLIRPGTYQRVITDKSVNMRGLGATPGEVNFFGFIGGTPSYGSSSFEDCTGPMRFSNLEFGGMHFTNCSGTVHLIDILLDEVHLNSSSLWVENETLSATESFSASVGFGSQAEFLHCYLRGSFTTRVLNGSYARFTDCNFLGGFGADAGPWGGQAGAGGNALWVDDHSYVHLNGKAGNTLQGGMGGEGDDIWTDGPGGAALFVEGGSSVRVSNFNLIGGTTPWTFVQSPAVKGDLASVTTPTLPDPLLMRTGSFGPGETSTFYMTGDPGAFAIAFLGITTSSVTLPGIAGNLATDYNGPFFTGLLNGSGRLSFDINMPISVPFGAFAVMQAGMVYQTDGSVRLTNPATIWVQ